MRSRTITQNAANNQLQTTSFQYQPPVYRSQPQNIVSYPNFPIDSNSSVTQDKFPYPVLPQPLPQI